MVECQLPKLDVAGSSPVSRSIIFINLFSRQSLQFHIPVWYLCQRKFSILYIKFHFIHPTGDVACNVSTKINEIYNLLTNPLFSFYIEIDFGWWFNQIKKLFATTFKSWMKEMSLIRALAHIPFFYFLPLNYYSL